MSHSSSGAVELMFGVKDEQDVHGLDQNRVRLVLAWSELVEHVQEILDVTILGVGIVELSSDSVAISIGCQSWKVS